MCPCNLSLDDGATYDFCWITTDAQFEALLGVFSGQLGGPMAGLAPLIAACPDGRRADATDHGQRPRFGVRGRPGSGSAALFALDVMSITWMALVVGLIAAPMPTMADGYM